MRGNFYYKKIGETIIHNRKKAKLTQEKLALLSDVDRSYLAEVERGKANPSMKFLKKISKTLKIKVGKLLKDV
ncbi:MAG: helix-turn-helix transcriptional regulator [Microgenomates group bacterium]|nr:helix-turn-helix transcriptional regulator [Microgenomates group bacterium]